LSFDPNPPPTSGATTRSFVSGIPVVPESVTRAMCGTCVADHIVYSPVASTGCTSTLRGSIAFGISRCWR
jgi:hypothetical protein